MLRGAGPNVAMQRQSGGSVGGKWESETTLEVGPRHALENVVRSPIEPFTAPP